LLKEATRMTDIDAVADIKIYHSSDEDRDQLSVRVPLAGHVTLEWLRCYRKLAQEKEVSALAEDQPDRSWIIVRIPANTGREQLLAMLDVACNLIPEADGAGQAPPAAARAEAIIREWWAQRRG
jgi:hypothetical protein